MTDRIFYECEKGAQTPVEFILERGSLNTFRDDLETNMERVEREESGGSLCVTGMVFIVLDVFSFCLPEFFTLVLFGPRLLSTFRDGESFEKYYRKTVKKKVEIIFSCSYANYDFSTEQ